MTATDRDPTSMQHGRPGPVARAASWPLEALVIVYRALISPLLPPSCRYYPSCSTYALTALRRFGPLIGTWLAVRRLARCHPWSLGGVDHVPPRGPRGLPDWAAHRAEAARREARWAAADADTDVDAAERDDVTHAGDAEHAHDVRNDDGRHPQVDPTPVRRGIP